MTAFDVLPIGASIPLIILILGAYWTAFLTYVCRAAPEVNVYQAITDEETTNNKVYEYFRRVFRVIKAFPKTFFSVFAIIVVYAVMICVATEGVCISEYPDTITTRFSRRFDADPCPEGSPCHIYLTYPENMKNAIIVNFQTAKSEFSESEPPMIYYDTVSHLNDADQDLVTAYNFSAKAKTLVYSTSDIKRGIHFVELTNLQENTTYYFRAGYGTLFSTEKKFLSIPEHGEIRFVSGGDMGTLEMAVTMSKIAAQQNPHFAMVGGDLPYAQGTAACYRVWDKWLSNWETYMVTPSGHLIPGLFAMGNHEAGFGLSKKDAVFYLPYFAQETDTSTDALQRSSYSAHALSDSSVIFVLDSNHISSSGGAQLQWLEEQMEKYCNYSNKMALFHVPLYASPLSYDSHWSQKLRTDWQPVFDRYHLTVAWENHDHTYSRSKLLKGGEENNNGTLYAGAGAWGVKLEIEEITQPWYLEKMTWANVELREEANNMQIYAINVNDQIFDNFTRSF